MHIYDRLRWLQEHPDVREIIVTRDEAAELLADFSRMSADMGDYIQTALVEHVALTTGGSAASEGEESS